MKVLIGTPIHQVKDYAMERWLKNVAQVQKQYPSDLLLVDNSPGLSYVKKVKEYIKKYGIRKYQIKHIEIPQGQDTTFSIDENIHERVARSREIIRLEVLKNGYDAWFSWECDQLIPSNGLKKLVGLMESGDLMLVDHNCWVNNVPGMVSFDFGVSLFRKDCLEKQSFLPVTGTWYDAESLFRNNLKESGANYLEVQGVIEPIYHLKQ